MGDVSWQERGACWNTDHRIFFPIRAEFDNEREYNDTVEKAQTICGGCVVRIPCEKAGETMEFGIWGGVLK